jgi:hypothetical protein
LGYTAEGINYQKKGTTIIYQTGEWYFNENECGYNRIQSPVSSEDYAVRVRGGDICIRFYTKETVQIRLVDRMGRSYYQSSFFSPQTEHIIIPSSSFPKGIYLLSVFYRDRNRISVSKIIH